VGCCVSLPGYQHHNTYPKQYILFANFYQKIIEPALRDINIYTDIEVSKVDKLKRGRKVVSLQFFIHRKSDVKIKEIFGIEELVVPESEELAEYEEIAGVMKNERDQMYLKFELLKTHKGKNPARTYQADARAESGQ